MILDGWSLSLFFKELFDLYQKFLSGNLDTNPKTDFRVYCRLMENIWRQERQDKEKKYFFWEQKIQKYRAKSSLDTQAEKKIQKNLKRSSPVSSLNLKIGGDQNYPDCSKNVFITKKAVRNIYRYSSKEKIGLFYVLSSLYSKVLQENLNINSLCLRVPFSSRYHLDQEVEKKLLASLSRSLPLFINEAQQNLKDKALDIQKQVRSARDYLFMDKLPWKTLNCFSKVKEKHLNLSMSYLPYKEEFFWGQIQSFLWQRAFLDLVLFMILSENRLLLSFSYKPEVFSKTEIQNLAQGFQKEALRL